MDSKIKTKLLLAVIFISAFAGIIIYRFTNTLPAIKANTGNTSAQVKAESASQDESIKSNIPRNDGFQQPVSDSPETIPHIEAIFITASGKSSIYMYGQNAYEGDIVEGFKVLKIYPDKAEFEKNGKIITAFISAP